MTEVISFGFMILFILIDIITGYIYSKISKTFKSSKMRLGFYHKFGEIGLVLLLYLVSYYTKLITPDVNLIEMFKLIECSSIYVVINEIGSIKENLILIKEYNN
jgi:hypothetical protein